MSECKHLAENTTEYRWTLSKLDGRSLRSVRPQERWSADLFPLCSDPNVHCFLSISFLFDKHTKERAGMRVAANFLEQPPTSNSNLLFSFWISGIGLSKERGKGAMIASRERTFTEAELQPFAHDAVVFVWVRIRPSLNFHSVDWPPRLVPIDYSDYSFRLMLPEIGALESVYDSKTNDLVLNGIEPLKLRLIINASQFNPGEKYGIKLRLRNVEANSIAAWGYAVWLENANGERLLHTEWIGRLFCKSPDYAAVQYDLPQLWLFSGDSLWSWHGKAEEFRRFSSGQPVIFNLRLRRYSLDQLFRFNLSLAIGKRKAFR